MVKVLLCGYNGAMGETILKNLPQDFEVVSGVGKEPEKRNFETVSKIDDVTEDFDLIIDFSHVSLLKDILLFAKQKQKPLLIASTGITDEDHALIDEISREIPIVQAGNYSLGVYAINEAIEKLALILDDYDLEIIEKHHRYKKDSPSGTAEMMFEALNSSRKNLYPVYGRSGQSEEKHLNEVGIHSLRAGTIVGEHSVIFSGEDEVVEIKHTAFSKKIFAVGAFKAARYILTKKAGRYTLRDVIENA